MDVRSDIFQGSPDGFHPREVSVRLARPDERTRWDALMDQRFPVILLAFYHTVILILKNINFVLYFHARFVFLRAKQNRVEK